MKKLSLIIALMLLVTVGGVYATWNYAQGPVDQKTAYLDGAVTVITDKKVDNAKGTITVDPRWDSIDGLKIVIDDANNDHVGELSITGKVLVNFEVAEGADDVVRDGGIVLEYIVSCTENWAYDLDGAGGNDPKPLFVINSNPQPVNGGNKVNGTAVYIPAAELLSLISLNDLQLHTAEEYDTFRAALHSGSISITVREKVDTP